MPQHSSSRVGSSVRFFTGSASDTDTRSHADRASSHHHNSSAAVGRISDSASSFAGSASRTRSHANGASS